MSRMFANLEKAIRPASGRFIARMQESSVISLGSNRSQPKRLSHDDIERVFHYVLLHHCWHEVYDGKASGDAPPDIGGADI